MGRTLHYQVLNPEDLADADLDALIAVSVAFNSGAFADAWTCENFFFEPMPVVPTKGGSWEQLQARWDALQADGLGGMALRRRLLAEGIGRQPGWLSANDTRFINHYQFWRMSTACQVACQVWQPNTYENCVTVAKQSG